MDHLEKAGSQSLICEMVSYSRKVLVKLNMAFLCNGILYKYPTVKSHEIKYFTDREKCSLHMKGKKQASKIHLQYDPKYTCIHTYVHTHKIQTHILTFKQTEGLQVHFASLYFFCFPYYKTHCAIREKKKWHFIKLNVPHRCNREPSFPEE